MITKDSKLAYQKDVMDKSVFRPKQADAVEIKFKVRKAHHYWRNRISMSTAKLSNNVKEWDYIIDKKVSCFYKPVTHFLNFSTLILVAHRNMLSTYNIAADEKSNDFVDTV